MCFCDLPVVGGKCSDIRPRVQYGHLAPRYPRVIGHVLVQSRVRVFLACHLCSSRGIKGGFCDYHAGIIPLGGQG